MRSVAYALIALFLLLNTAVLHADINERRIAVGGRLFIAMLAATNGIEERLSRDGALEILVVYQDFPRPAEQLARQLNQDTVIRGLPVRAVAVSIDDMDKQRVHQVAGVFIAEPMVWPLSRLIELCREQQLTLFSPFPGDVERGVSGGVAISDRILPLVNLRALNDAGLELKPFFLRIAERYE